MVGLDLTSFDRQRFLPHQLDPQAYGKLLSECVFPDDRARRAFDEARTKAQTLGVPLRVQLVLHPEMPLLHDLRWELLRDPVDDTSLGEPKIWLDDDEGNVEVISGAALVGHLMEIRCRPKLIMIVSCQSAGRGDDAALTDEGPQVHPDSAGHALPARIPAEAGGPAGHPGTGPPRGGRIS